MNADLHHEVMMSNLSSSATIFGAVELPPEIARQRVLDEKQPPSSSACPMSHWSACANSARLRNICRFRRGALGIACVIFWLGSTHAQQVVARPPEPCPTHANAALAGAALRLIRLAAMSAMIAGLTLSFQIWDLPDVAARWLQRRYRLSPLMRLIFGREVQPWSALDFNGRLPVRPHLRPRPRRKVRSSADVPAWLLAAYSHLIAELNLCSADVWVGEGKPGAGWDGWTYEHVPLDAALALPCEARHERLPQLHHARSHPHPRRMAGRLAGPALAAALRRIGPRPQECTDRRAAQAPQRTPASVH